jgi:hypothetical protein
MLSGFWVFERDKFFMQCPGSARSPLALPADGWGQDRAMVAAVDWSDSLLSYSFSGSLSFLYVRREYQKEESNLSARKFLHF